MLAFGICISLTALVIVTIKKNTFLRSYFHDKLSKIGLQFGNTIYTPVCDIQTDYRLFDIVFTRKENTRLQLSRIFHKERFYIPLTYVEPGYKLKYKVNNQIQDIPYYDGTPFTLDQGILTMYKSKVGKMGITSQYIGESIQWPFQYDYTQ